jgi:probable F420-dependent oxidoreductase
MQIGLYAPTHGIGYRDAQRSYTNSTPTDRLDPLLIARSAEAAGFHSLWFPDHVCMPASTHSAHVANSSGARTYSARHVMWDAAVTMGAVAAVTRRILIATSVLIAPYRNPLSDARQFATLDVISGGRMILGVGAGWMREEFEALGIPFAERGSRTEEAIQIYRAAWNETGDSGDSGDPAQTSKAVEFHGAHFSFSDLSMDPKPLGRPLIVYGGMSPRGARRAAQLCDGLYPLFLDPTISPDALTPLQEIVKEELARLGRDTREFAMLAAIGLRVDAPGERTEPPRICAGSPDQVLEGLARYAAAGYSTVVAKLDCPTGEQAELLEQIARVGSEIIPAATEITAQGHWRQEFAR